MTEVAFVKGQDNGVTFIPLSEEEAEALFMPLTGMAKVHHSGICGIRDYLGAGRAFAAYQGGERVAAFSILKIDREHGKELEIRAAIALGPTVDATESILPAIEYAFGYDCKQVTVYTKRAGLMKKLSLQGYAEAAVIMRKRI